MKEVKAFVRRARMDEVVHGLKSIGVKAMSILPVEGIGALTDPSASTLSISYVTNYSLLYKIEIVCIDDDADRIIDVLLKNAHTGNSGDGVIFVSNIERAIKIRNGEEGHFVLDKAEKSEEHNRRVF